MFTIAFRSHFSLKNDLNLGCQTYGPLRNLKSVNCLHTIEVPKANRKKSTTRMSNISATLLMVIIYVYSFQSRSK